MAKDTQRNVEQELKQLIANVIGRDPEELKPETDFWKDLGVDSIKAIEITVAIERHFKIAIRDEQIPKITNFDEAVKVVRQALVKKEKA